MSSFYHGDCVIPPDEIKLSIVNNRQLGAGAISLDPEDCFVLYQLYRKHPTRSLKSYVRELYYYTGTIVSQSTVSRFFNHGFAIKVKGCLCKANFTHGRSPQTSYFFFNKFRAQPIIIRFTMGRFRKINGKMRYLSPLN